MTSTMSTLGLGPNPMAQMAQKPYITWSLGPTTLEYESLEPKGNTSYTPLEAEGSNAEPAGCSGAAASAQERARFCTLGGSFLCFGS